MENPSQSNPPCTHSDTLFSLLQTVGTKPDHHNNLVWPQCSVFHYRDCSSSSLWFCWQETPLCSLWDCQTIWCLPTRSYVGTFTSKHNLLLSQILHWKSTERGTPPAAIGEQEPLLQVLGLQFQDNFTPKKPLKVLILSVQKMEGKCFRISLCNLMSFNVILHGVIKGSFCIFFISTEASDKQHVHFHRLWGKLLPFPSPLSLHRDSSLSHPFSQFPIFRPVWVCVPWEELTQLPQTQGSCWFCSRVTQSGDPDEDPSPAPLEEKDITNSCFALLSNCSCDLWDAFNNPSMLGFWFPRLVFFQKLFSRRGVHKGRVSALPRNPWETYLSPVPSWMHFGTFLTAGMPSAFCSLNFTGWFEGHPPSILQPQLNKTQWSAGLHFYSRNCFFICLFVHFSLANFYLTVQWTVSNPVFL